MSTQSRRLKDLNERLLEMVRRISLADDLQSALEILLEQASSLVPSDGTSIMLLTGDHLEVLASRGSTAPMVGLTLPTSQMGAGRAVLDGRRAVVVADTAEDRRWVRVPGEEQVRSWLGAPLLLEGRALGLLEWNAKNPNRFDKEDVEIAEQIASSAAPVLHRAQLLDDTRTRLRELLEPRLDAVPRVADLGTELYPVVEEALEFSGARHAFAFVRRESNHRLRCVVAAGGRRAQLMRTILRGDGTLGGWSVPMAGSSDWLGAGPSDREVMSTLGIERTLILPLLVGKEEVGMLGVAEPQRRRGFGRDAMRLMTHLASQASLIVERVYPVQRTQKKPDYDYDMVIQSSPLGVGVLTVTGDIRVSNPALAGMLSHSSRSLRGYNLAEFLVAEDARRLELALEEVAVTRQRQQVDAQVQSRRGEHRHVRISLALARFSGDAGGNLIAVTEDVTSLKILEEERVKNLQELSEKHEQLQDLDELKSRFVSNVSHELRTPLAVIKLYATLSRKGRPEKQDYYLQTIEQETHRLETMVENILDLSRMDRQALRVDPEWLQPEDVINQVLEVYAETALKRGIELENQLQGELPKLWADKDHLIQMMTNLVDNALKYSGQGARVWVAARQVSSEPQDMLEIAVGDTGPGISEDEQGKVFERFYRGRNNATGATGTGLGLAIVRELMGRHDGHIKLESRQGEGSVFTLQFPIYGEDDLPEALNGAAES